MTHPCPMTKALTGLKRFEKLQLKRQRNINHLNFLLECKRRKLVPHSMQLRCNSSSKRINSTLRRSEFAIIRAQIKDIRNKLDSIEIETYKLYLELSKNLHPIIWHSVLSRTMTKAHYNGLEHKKLQKKKINNLVSKKKSVMLTTIQPMKLNNPITNLSSISLTDSEKEVLSLGLNFAIAAKTNIQTTAIDSECAFKKVARSRNKFTSIQPNEEPVSDINSNTVDKARENVISAASNFPATKPNLNKQEYMSLKSITSNPDIFIMRADKGGQIAIVDKTDYTNKVATLLNDEVYKLNDKDCTQATLIKLKKAVKNSTFLDQFEKSNAIPSSAVPARLYALPKVHKPDNPYRPIVSGIGTVTYPLSRILSKKLGHLTTSNIYTVKDSETLVNKLKVISVSNDSNLISFDVKSLFTKVPLLGALNTLKQRLSEIYSCQRTIDDIVELVTICTTDTQFSFNDKLYKQTEGLAMGNPLSPLLADIYMHYFETTALNSNTVTTKPKIWIRYVDDIFCIWNGSDDELQAFLLYLNSINPNIQFTIEIGGKSLPFLDVLIQKCDNRLIFKVYRKAFSVNLPIHKRSAHPWSQKMTAFYCYVRRALVISSNDQFLHEEIMYLKQVAISRGYSPSIIDKALNKFKRKMRKDSNNTSTLTSAFDKPKIKYSSMTYYPGISPKISTELQKINIQAAFKPAKTISNLIPSTKDKIPTTKKWGIYQIDCECGLAYIGQTKRTLAIRSKEHEKHVTKNEKDKSAIAKHAIENKHHFNFNKPKLLYQPKYPSQLDISETVFIRSFRNILVNSDVMPYLHYSWNKLLTRFHLPLTPVLDND